MTTAMSKKNAMIIAMIVDFINLAVEGNSRSEGMFALYIMVFPIKNINDACVRIDLQNEITCYVVSH
ncbi:hypothetical protein IMCC1989_2071 [gamma proteobacterium IMCC1989]|nr:hypothetical protein IMCC1989_2071 [gamma proteobacterium IMCC1989]